jgi:hypothetical protein
MATQQHRRDRLRGVCRGCCHGEELRPGNMRNIGPSCLVYCLYLPVLDPCHLHPLDEIERRRFPSARAAPPASATRASNIAPYVILASAVL